MRNVSIPLLLAANLIACGNKDDSESGDTGTSESAIDEQVEGENDGTDDTAAEDTGTGEAAAGFGLSGVVTDAFTTPPTPAPGGLCVMAADPTPAMVGGELAILATGFTEEGGSYSLSGIETASTLGIVIIVQDCEGDAAVEPTMYPTGTGIAFETYGELEAGDTTTLNLHQLRMGMLSDIDAALTEAEYLDAPPESDGAPSTFTAQGGLIAFMRDADGVPVPNATIDCAAGYCPTYYNANAGGDGLSFMGDDGLATETGMDGLAFLPGAPITNYSGSHASIEFESRTMGSLPGVALVVDLDQVIAP